MEARGTVRVGGGRCGGPFATGRLVCYRAGRFLQHRIAIQGSNLARHILLPGERSSGVGQASESAAARAPKAAPPSPWP